MRLTQVLLAIFLVVNASAQQCTRRLLAGHEGVSATGECSQPQDTPQPQSQPTASSDADADSVDYDDDDEDDGDLPGKQHHRQHHHRTHKHTANVTRTRTL